MTYIYDLPFKVGDLFVDTPGESRFGGPTRLLAFDRATNRSWLIRKPSLQTGEHKNRMRHYVSSPFEITLSELVELIKSHRARLLTITKRLPTSTDKPIGQIARLQQRIAANQEIRKSRYSIIEPIICKRIGEKWIRHPTLKLLKDPSLPKKLRDRAKETKVSISTIYRLFNLYFANGETQHALSSGYGRCGNEGARKFQIKKVGRHSRAYKAGKVNSTGYVLDLGRSLERIDEDLLSDRNKLAYGYQLIKHGTSAYDAFLTISSMHWSKDRVEADGTVSVSLLPKLERPTFAQFKYWGRKLNGNKDIASMILGIGKSEQRTRAVGGSIQDRAQFLGQQGVFDATSTDNYLVSITSRLVKLPPMTRSILYESRSQVILGFYCGWEAPSPRTALLTILHGASCKKEQLRRFKLPEHLSESLPAMLCRNNLADNGELKAQAATEAETQIGFDIEYTPPYQGEKKGDAESGHRAEKIVNAEKIPGSTRGGKAYARGETHPSELALFNYYEYMREFIQYAVGHNNGLVPHLAPTQMLLEGIEPTRINIFNWLRAQGQTADIPVDLEAFRALMLPEVDAVIRKNGVYIEANVLGYRQILPRMRFNSPELIATRLLSQVKITNKTIRTRLKFDEGNLLEAWLPTQQGMIRLENTCKDSALSSLNLFEFIRAIENLTHIADAKKDMHEQHAATRIAERDATKNRAASELAHEHTQNAEASSTATLKSGLRFNSKREMQLLKESEKYSDGVPHEEASPPEHETTVNLSPYSSTASDAMKAFHAAKKKR